LAFSGHPNPEDFDPMADKILVAGATGTLGGMIVQRLLERGSAVRCLVRPASDHRALREAGAEICFGNLRDLGSLDAAMEGVGAVVTTANSARRGGDDNVLTVEIDGNRNLIDAARRAGVEQFVFVSALGASLDNPVPFMRGKAMTEEYLRASGVPYTILAPNVFMEAWIGMVVGMPVQSGRPVTLVGEGRRRHAFVSIEDVADFAVAALGNPSALNQYIPIAGPLAVSWREVVDVCQRALGREIPVQRVAPGEPVPGFPETVGQLMAAFETYDSGFDMTETARRFGITLTPVEAFVRQAFGSNADA
jgi:uncharacterized protein YbjT (DUF2867 family)